MLLSDKLASKQSLGEIFEPGKGDVGYGWFIQRDLNRLLITQSGFTPGFAAQVFRYPDDKVCIILLNNFENGAPHLWRTGHDLAAILFGEKYELQRERVAIKVDPRIYDAYVGEYRFDSNRILFITREGDKLFAQAAGKPKGEIFPESETIFFYPFTDVQFEFIKNETGKVGGMIFRQGGGQESKGDKVK